MSQQTSSTAARSTLRSALDALQHVRSSVPLSLAFWGGLVTLATLVLRDGAWVGLLGIWGVTLLVLGSMWYVLSWWLIR